LSIDDNGVGRKSILLYHLHPQIKEKKDPSSFSYPRSITFVLFKVILIFVFVTFLLFQIFNIKKKYTCVS